VGALKSLLHSAQVQNEETFHLNISDACQTICNRPGPLKGCNQVEDSERLLCTVTCYTLRTQQLLDWERVRQIDYVSCKLSIT
jgi:hypothetical protein